MSEPTFLYKSRNAAEAQLFESKIIKLLHSYILEDTYDGKIEVYSEYPNRESVIIKGDTYFQMELRSGKPSLLITDPIKATGIKGKLNNVEYEIRIGEEDSPHQYSLAAPSSYSGFLNIHKDERISEEHADQNLELIAVSLSRIVVRSGKTYLTLDSVK